MSEPAILKCLITTQNKESGSLISVTNVNVSKTPVAITAMQYPGDNVDSTIVTSKVIKSCYFVGGDNVTKVGRNDNDEEVYSLHLPYNEVLCASDYYVVAQFTYSDGSVSKYQTIDFALPLKLAPEPVQLDEYSAKIERIVGDYTDATITIYFDENICDLCGNDFTYTVACQYTTVGEVGPQILTTTGLTYNTSNKSIHFDITTESGIIDAYVAVIAVRTTTTNGDVYYSNSEISNTVECWDTDVPQPVTDLNIKSYTFNAVPPLINLEWGPNNTYVSNPPTGFNVHRSINGEQAVKIGSVSFVSGTNKYTYSDDVTIDDVTISDNDTLTYFIITYEDQSSETLYSSPSNEVNQVILQPSGAPTDLGATGLLEVDASEASLNIIFGNPLEIGETPIYDYDTPFFRIKITDVCGNLLDTDDTTQYDVNEDLYSVNLNDIVLALPIKKHTAVLTVSVQLVTYDSDNNGDEVEGIPATVDVVVSEVPFIYNVNGEGNYGTKWTAEKPLQTFDVATFVIQTASSPTLLVRNRVSQEFHTLVIPTVTPTKIPDGYEAFLEGAYNYSYDMTGLLGENEYVASIAACNSVGLRVIHVDGVVL